MRTLPRVLSLPVLFLAHASVGLAQERELVRSELTCPDCVITLVPVATLGLTPDSVALLRSSKVALSPDGNFVVAPTYARGVMASYRPDGAFHRVFGRLGQGPGEFLGNVTSIMISPGGQVNVFEGTRRTMLSQDLADVVALQNLPLPPFGRAFLPSGQLVVQHSRPSSTSEHPPWLHFISDDGDIERSIPTRGIVDSRASYDWVRPFAAASNGELWSTRFSRYELDRWSVAGTWLGGIRREAAWFPPWDGVPVDGEPFAVRPRPRVGWIRVDVNGLARVSVHVPDPSWEALSPSHLDLSQVEAARVFDAVIEVIDLEEGSVVARGRFDHPMLPATDDASVVYWHRATNEGLVVIEVARLEVLDPRR